MPLLSKPVQVGASAICTKYPNWSHFSGGSPEVDQLLPTSPSNPGTTCFCKAALILNKLFKQYLSGIVWGYFPAKMAEWSSCDRDCMDLRRNLSCCKLPILSSSEILLLHFNIYITEEEEEDVPVEVKMKLDTRSYSEVILESACHRPGPACTVGSAGAQRRRHTGSCPGEPSSGGQSIDLMPLLRGHLSPRGRKEKNRAPHSSTRLPLLPLTPLCPHRHTPLLVPVT